MNESFQLSAFSGQHSALSTQHSKWALSTSAVLQVVLLAGIFVLNFFMVTDPDLWWHLAAGRLIVETGSLPRVDPFSYTAAGKPWVAHEWLAEIIIYLVYRSGGYLAAVLLFASLITATFWLVLRVLRRLGMSVAGASCITFWVALMSLAGWNVRPQVFSYLLFSLYLYLLVRARERADRSLWLLPALMAVWVNLHAGYVMGLALLGLFLLGEGINRFQHSALSTQHSALRTYLAVTAATVAATVVNPQGLSLLLYPLTYAGTQNASMKYISEWQSPNFHDYFFFIFGASMMVLMVVPGRRRVDWALALPLLTFLAMSLQSARVIPFYALAAAPFLGMRLAGRRGDAETRGRGEEQVLPDQDSTLVTHHSSPITHHSKRATPWNWLLLALCLAVLASTPFLSDRAQLGPEPHTTNYPAAGARFLGEAGLTGKLFNTYHWGGYLAWTFYPERRVFIDGRADMYGDGFMEQYKTVYEVRPGWREVLEEHQVEIALVEKDSGTATLLAASGEWQELFRGEVETVLARSLSRGEARDRERSTR